MPIVIGIDEAGYGPNFGPLVVAATVWEVGDEVDCRSLYKRLRRVVTNRVELADRRRVCWADSKAVYRQGKGLDLLERGVLSAVAMLQTAPRCWSALWPALDWQSCKAPLATTIGSSRFADSSAAAGAAVADDFDVAAECWQSQPWYDGYACDLPLAEGCLDELQSFAVKLSARLAGAGVRLLQMFARPVFPAEFNALIDRCGNKSDALSRVSLELAAAALRSIEGEHAIEIACDKHGGRNRYHAHLQTQFADAWIEVRSESSLSSTYRFREGQATIDIGFWTSGEQFLPVALASMTAKYLREAAMRPFNEFWCARIEGLKPTAGYPGDARRFKEQIAALQQQLQIDDAVIWRNR